MQAKAVLCGVLAAGIAAAAWAEGPPALTDPLAPSVLAINRRPHNPNPS
jgi:hypothetical protein